MNEKTPLTDDDIKVCEDNCTCQDVADAISVATEEIIDKSKKINELEDEYKRLQAEFDNYHKRTDKEIIKIKLTATKELMIDLINYLDELEESMKHVNNSKDDKIKEGLIMLHNNLLKTLSKYGLKEMIIEDNDEFDPFKHEAIMQQESNEPEGKILSVYHKGYLLNNEIIRHAQVCIAKKKEEQKKE